MNQSELIAVVAENANMPKTQMKNLYDMILNALISAAKEDGGVRTDIGVFKVVRKEARTCRNPATGGTIEVPAKNVLKFKPAKNVLG